MSKTKLIAALVLLGVLVAMVAYCFYSDKKIKQLKEERDKYKSNTEILSGDCERYRTADSLSAARVKALTLDLEEFERLRAKDAATIKGLQAKNRELAAVNETQVETIIELSGRPRDTVIIQGGGEVPAVAVRCGDPWYDFEGVLTEKEFTGKLSSRDSLIISESVQHKRFLGFLWKMKAVKDRQIDCVSRNPHTQIQDITFVVIED